MKKDKLQTIMRGLFWVGSIACLLFLLYLRFQEAITRGYGPDEYYHLHYVYLLTQGKLPFRDFANIYSPLFHLTLYPIFKVVGEKYLVLTLGRVVVFFYFLVSLFFTFKIARFFLSSSLSLMVVLTAAVFPLPVEKALEIRPDNLMTMLCLGGVFFILKGLSLDCHREPAGVAIPLDFSKSGRDCFVVETPRNDMSLSGSLSSYGYTSRVDFFLAGFFFMLSVLVMQKIIFTVGGFLLGVVFLLLMDKKARKKVVEGGVLFYIGGGIVLAIFLLILFLFGILPQALASILIYPRMAVSSLRFGTELHPFYWFYPIDAVYGTYKGLPWYVSNLLILLAVVGVGSSFLKIKKNKIYTYRLLLFPPMVFSFLYLFIVLRPFHQYLLPFCLFVPFFVVFAFADIGSFLDKRGKAFKYLVFFLSLGFFVLSMWQSWQVKKRWYDENDRKFIQYILTRTDKDDVFWGEPSYIFRLDGYFDYSGKLGETSPKLKEILPPFIPVLEQRKTKYLLFSTDALKNRTWPFDQMEVKPFAEWIEKNFQPSDYPNLWVRKGSV